MFRNIKYLIYILSLKYKAFVTYLHDYRNHVKYSTRYHSNKNKSKDMLRCSIMLLNHQLEKAQTYTEMKDGYGKQKIRDLLYLTEMYIKKYDYDSLIFTSLGVMKAHFGNSYSYKNEDLINRYKKIYDSMDKKMLKNRGGIEVLDMSKNNKLSGLLPFMHSRHSCRSYSEAEISDNEIELAIEYAMTAPSACNRQFVRAHYFNNPTMIKDIVLSQKSDVNWCIKAKGLFVITANKSYLRDYYERNQGMFDAGLFSMNLVLGLHNQGIGSCFKMAQKESKIDEATKNIARIPKEEDICVLLLLGKYPNSPSNYAKSSRLDENEILTIHN